MSRITTPQKQKNELARLGYSRAELVGGGVYWFPTLKCQREDDRDHGTASDAAKQGHLECLRFSYGRGDHERKGHVWTPQLLAWTAYSGHLDCLKYIHSTGVQLDKWTLMWAIQYDHPDCEKYALDNGCPQPEGGVDAWRRKFVRPVSLHASCT